MLENGDDLAALRVPEEDDRLSQLLRDHWPLSVSLDIGDLYQY